MRVLAFSFMFALALVTQTPARVNSDAVPTKYFADEDGMAVMPKERYEEALRVAKKMQSQDQALRPLIENYRSCTKALQELNARNIGPRRRIHRTRSAAASKPPETFGPSRILVPLFCFQNAPILMPAVPGRQKKPPLRFARRGGLISIRTCGLPFTA